MPRTIERGVDCGRCPKVIVRVLFRDWDPVDICTTRAAAWKAIDRRHFSTRDQLIQQAKRTAKNGFTKQFNRGRAQSHFIDPREAELAVICCTCPNGSRPKPADPPHTQPSLFSSAS